MDLSKLIAPEGEKTVLMLGETHHADDLELMLTILNHFQPTAIAIEDRLESLAQGLVTRLREIHKETITQRPPIADDYAEVSHDAGTVAIIHAARQNLPLYFIDHQPFSPLEVNDIFTSQLQEPSYRDFADGLENAIIALCGPGAHEKARTEDIYKFYRYLNMCPWDIDVRLNNEARLFRERLPADEAEAAILHSRYLLTPQGIAARNQYSALALNNLQEERILYVGGHLHFSRDAFKDFDSFVPLHELVDAQHKYYISMKSLRSKSIRDEVLLEFGADDFPVKITKTVHPRLSHEVFK